jgi:hypothetical protein
MWLVGGAAAAASATGVVASCLPDLDAVPAQKDSAFDLCGNGRIDTDAEQCDPGPHGAVPGCTSKCQIDCDAGPLLSYLDPSSNHCYFLRSADAGRYEGPSACKSERAHIVTLGTNAEFQTLRAGGDLSMRSEAFWLGVHEVPADAGADDAADAGAEAEASLDAGLDGPYSAVVDEPAFAHPGECEGCFLPFVPGVGGLRTTGHQPTECVSWVPDLVRWTATDCDAGLLTLCEREPAGSRVYDCNDRLCFDILLEARQGTRKAYVWIPERVSADAGASLCASLSDAGMSSLVVFQKPQQREQIFYELMHLPVAGEAGPPRDVWVGLTSRRINFGDGSKLSWVWDDGTYGSQFPEWGDKEPRTDASSVRAYALQTGTSYDQPASNFDTQLLHAQDPLTDGGTEVHAVLCQILLP